VRFLETPATVWGAESVLIDEISRCKPEHQNRLFSLVHERKLQGLPLKRLKFRWAAMNPCMSDQGGTEDYSGSEPLDRTHVDRFGARKAREMGVEAVKKGAGECLVRAVYAPNVAEPLDVQVEVSGGDTSIS